MDCPQSAHGWTDMLSCFSDVLHHVEQTVHLIDVKEYDEGILFGGHTSLLLNRLQGLVDDIGDAKLQQIPLDGDCIHFLDRQYPHQQHMIVFIQVQIQHIHVLMDLIIIQSARKPFLKKLFTMISC